MVVYVVVETINGSFVGAEVFNDPGAALDCFEYRTERGLLMGLTTQKFTIIRSEVCSDFKPIPINTTMPPEKGD